MRIMRAMAGKKYRLRPVLGVRGQAKRDAERLLCGADPTVWSSVKAA